MAGVVTGVAYFFLIYSRFNTVFCLTSKHNSEQANISHETAFLSSAYPQSGERRSKSSPKLQAVRRT